MKMLFYFIDGIISMLILSMAIFAILGNKDQPTHYTIKYDLPEEMMAADKGDLLKVYHRDTSNRVITVYLQFHH